MILCVNAGSSSLKLALFDGERRMASTTVERIGTDVAATLNETGARERKRGRYWWE